MELKTEIQTLKKEINYNKDLVLEKEDIISKQKKELEAFKQRESNKKYYIISGIDEALTLSENMFEEYLNNVEVSYMKNNFYIDMLYKSLELNNLIYFDLIIYKISDDVLSNLTQFELDKVLEAIKCYLKQSLDNDNHLGRGVFYFLNKILNLRWQELIIDFLRNTRENIEKILYKNTNREFRSKNLLLLLKFYFLLDLSKEANNLINDIIRNLSLENIPLETKDKLEVLLIALLWKKDDLIIDQIPDMYQLINSNIKEVECYKLYYKGLDDKSKASEIASSISELEKQCLSINYDIKTKVFEQMYIKLNEATEKYKKELKQIQNSKNSVINKLSVKLDSRTVVKEVSLIQVKQKECPYCSAQLKDKLCNLGYYESKKKHNVVGYKEVKLLHCNKCNAYFINHYIKNDLKKIMSVKRFKIIPLKTLNSSLRVDRDRDNLKSNILANDNLANDNSHLLDNKYADKLNAKSDLARLGYNIQLTREQRWNILKNKAIPTLGKQWIIKHLKWLINDRQRIKSRDFSRAINEWQYDIERLRKVN